MQDFAKWSRNNASVLVCLEVAYDAVGRTVAVRHVYRNKTNQPVSFYHPDKNAFDKGASFGLKNAGFGVIDDVLVSVQGSRAEIAGVVRGGVIASAASHKPGGTLYHLRDRQQVTFLVPGFDHQGMTNVSALQSDPNAWVPLPVWEYSAALKTNTLLPNGLEDRAVTYLGRYRPRQGFDFRLDEETNTVSEVTESEGGMVVVRCGGLGLFGWRAVQNESGGIADVLVYGYGECEA